MRDFIAHHDERWLFVIIYVGLAVVLSVMLSLFWLVAVAGLHLGLEYLRQSERFRTSGDILAHAVWEIRLDLALVLLALAMALYMDVVLGVLGLQSAARATAAARAGARVTRIAAWQRNIRAFVLMADDVFRVGQAALSRMLRREPDAVPASVTADDGSGGSRAAGGAASAGAAGAKNTGSSGGDGSRSETAVKAAPAGGVPVVGWRDSWTLGDRATLAMGVGCMALIALAPVFTPHDWTGAMNALLTELRPFP